MRYLVLALLLMGCSDPVVDAILLPVPFRQQICTRWCWAAAAQMVGAYYHRAPPSQCRMATLATTADGTDCCGPDSCLYPECNFAGRPDLVLSNLLGVRGTVKEGTLTLSQLKSELLRRRPVMVGYVTPEYGHVVVISGFNSNTFHVLDPLTGARDVTYHDLVYGYREGGLVWQWGLSFYHLAPR